MKRSHSTEARQQLLTLHDVGISIGDTRRDHDRHLGWDKVPISKPLFHGDTIHVQTEVIEVREIRKQPDLGSVTFVHRCFNRHE